MIGHPLAPPLRLVIDKTAPCTRQDPPLYTFWDNKNKNTIFLYTVSLPPTLISCTKNYKIYLCSLFNSSPEKCEEKNNLKLHTIFKSLSNGGHRHTTYLFIHGTLVIIKLKELMRVIAFTRAQPKQN